MGLTFCSWQFFADSGFYLSIYLDQPLSRSTLAGKCSWRQTRPPICQSQVDLSIAHPHRSPQNRANSLLRKASSSRCQTDSSDVWPLQCPCTERDQLKADIFLVTVAVVMSYTPSFSSVAAVCVTPVVLLPSLSMPLLPFQAKAVCCSAIRNVLFLDQCCFATKWLNCQCWADLECAFAASAERHSCKVSLDVLPLLPISVQKHAQLCDGTSALQRAAGA